MEVVWWLGVTPLQTNVLRALVIILVVNCGLITFFWHVYSKRITHTLSFSQLEACLFKVKFCLPESFGLNYHHRNVEKQYHS